MTSVLENVAIDCADAYELARFWSAVTGCPVRPDARPGDHETQVALSEGPVLYFNQVPEPKTVKNRLHLCLGPATSREAEIERLLGLGAVFVADPEGNEFCVLRTASERAAMSRAGSVEEGEGASVADGESVARPDHRALVDSDERPVAVIEVTGVWVVPLADVDLAHVVDEGEGHTSVAEWREEHERSGTARRCVPRSGILASPWTTRRRPSWNGSGSPPTSVPITFDPPSRGVRDQSASLPQLPRGNGPRSVHMCVASCHPTITARVHVQDEGDIDPA